MTNPPPGSPGPPPGWYPDPSGEAEKRWWDGATWTDKTQARPTDNPWGAPSAQSRPTPQAPQGAPLPPKAYNPIQSPVTAAGMRRIPALFSDAGRIIKRAWLPIIGTGLAIWGAWAVLVLLTTALVVDFGNLARALNTSMELTSGPNTGQLSPTLQDELAAQWSAVVRTDSVWVWVGLAIALTVLTIVVASYQATAATKLSMDAVVDRPARFGDAMKVGFPAAVRLSIYLIVFAVVLSAVSMAAVLLIVAGASVGGGWVVIAVLVSVAGFLAMFVAIFWIVGRLIPVLAQVVLGPGAITWSWHATAGRFWAVLGRYFLWSIVASFALQVVSSVLLTPIGFASAFVVNMETATGAIVAVVLFLFLIWPITMAASSLTLIGVVAIWRDLTDDPRYRSIGADGLPVPDSSGATA